MDLVPQVKKLREGPARHLPGSVLISLADSGLQGEEVGRAAQILAKKYDLPATAYGLTPIKVGGEVGYYVYQRPLAQGLTKVVDNKGVVSYKYSAPGGRVVDLTPSQVPNKYKARTVYLSAARAHHLMNLWEPSVFEQVIRSIPNKKQAGEINAIVPRAKQLGLPPSTSYVATRAAVLTIAGHLLKRTDFRQTSFNIVMGVATQVAVALQNNQQAIELFGRNLDKFKLTPDITLPTRVGQGLFANPSGDVTGQPNGKPGAGGIDPSFSLAVALSEAAAMKGYAFVSATDAYQYFGIAPDPSAKAPTRLDVIKVMAQNSSIREYNGRFYAWNPFHKAYELLTDQERTQIQALQTQANRYDLLLPVAMTTDPSTWSAPTDANIPSQDGAYVDPTLKLTLAQQLAVQQYGLGPNLLSHDQRPADYYAQSLQFGRDSAIGQATFANSLVGRGIGEALRGLNLALGKVQGTLIRVVGGTMALAERPFVGAAETASDWQAIQDKARVFDAGKAFLGTEAVGDLSKIWNAVMPGSKVDYPPWLTRLVGFGVDLYTMKAIDPMFWSTETVKAWQGLHSLQQLAEENSLVIRTARNVVADLEPVNDALKRIDNFIGAPILGSYVDAAGDVSRGARYRRFVELFLDRPRFWLQDRSLVEYLTANAAVDDPATFWIRANARMRGVYVRQAFTNDLTSKVYALVQLGKKAGLSEAEIEPYVRDFLLSGFGAKSLPVSFFEGLIYETSPNAARVGPGGSVTGLPPSLGGSTELRVPRPAFGVYEDVLTPRESPVAARYNPGGGFTGMPGQHVPMLLTPDGTQRLAGYDINQVLADEAYLRSGFVGGIGSEANRMIFGAIQPEIPKYAPMRALKQGLAAGSDTELGRAMRALFNAQPEGAVPFEGTRTFEQDIRARLIRARVFNSAEVDQITQKAIEASRLANPVGRESAMISFVEKLNRQVFDRVASSMGLPKSVWDDAFAQIMEGSGVDGLNFNKGEAFGIKYSRDPATGEIVREVVKDHPLGTTQLANSWYAPDPLAMRRVLRNMIGDLTSFEQWRRRVGETWKGLDLLPGELESSTQGQAFHTALEESMAGAGMDKGTRRWWHSLNDLVATRAVSSGRFSTFDEYFSNFRTEIGGTSVGDGLFRALWNADPEVRQLTADVQDLLAGGRGGAEAWHSLSKAALDRLGAKYLFGETTLADGTVIPDQELFTQMLVARSAGTPTADELASTVREFMQAKAGVRPDGASPLVNEILDGKRTVSSLGKAAQAQLLKAGYALEDTIPTTIDTWGATGLNAGRMREWSLYRNLKGDMSNVTVDNWMFQLFGFADGSQEDYLKVEKWVRDIAAANGIEPAQAQAALWGIYKARVADKMQEWSTLLRTEDPATAVAQIAADRESSFIFTDSNPLPNPADKEAVARAAQDLSRSVSGVRDSRNFGELLSFAPDLGKSQGVVLSNVDSGLTESLANNTISGAQALYDMSASSGFDRVIVGKNIVRVDVRGNSYYFYVSPDQQAVLGYRSMPTGQVDPNHISLVFVDPANQGQGIGRSLVEASMRDQGFSSSEIAQYIENLSYSPAGGKNMIRGLEQIASKSAPSETENLLKQIGAQSAAGPLPALTRDDIMQEFAGLRRTAADGQVLGVTRFGPGGSGVVQVMDTADPMTFIHEMGHWVRQLMSPEELRVIESEIGAKFGSLTDLFGTASQGVGVIEPKVSAAARDAEEKFAKLVETYFNTRQASPGTRSVLERIRQFFSGIWAKIRNDSGISSSSRKVLEDWFGEPKLPVPLTEEGARILSPAEVDLEGGARTASRWMKRALEHSGRWYMKVWKPWQVLRPAYILRVPGFDEQIRFLADQGVRARLSSQASFANAAERWLPGRDMGSWGSETKVIVTRDGAQYPITQRLPGTMIDEAYANATAGGEDAFATFAQQMSAAANNRVLRQSYGEITPAMTGDYAGAAETALNGHIGESPQGFLVLRDIANGVPEEQSVTKLERWLRTDPDGKLTATRMGIPQDELAQYSQDYVAMVRRYTFADPDIATAAIHRRFTADMLDAHLGAIDQRGADWLQAHRLDAPRPLPAVDSPDSNLAERVRIATREAGGAVFDPVSGDPYTKKTGFGVGVLPETAQLAPKAALSDPVLWRQKWDAFLAKPEVQDALTRYPDARISTWVDDAGVVHIEPSVVTSDYADAAGIAYNTKQRGVLDFSQDPSADASFIPTVEKPTVHGLYADTMSSTPQNPYRSVINFASKYILQEPTNRLSRQPFFKVWFQQMMDAQMELAKSQGLIPDNIEAAQAMEKVFEQNARRFAIERVQRIMFNVRDQSRLSEMMWFVAPFTQPFFEAFSVYGNLIRRNPTLLAWAYAVMREATKAGVFKKDPQTGQLVVPMTNWLGYGSLMRVLSFGRSGSFGLSVPLSALNLFYNNAVPVSFPGLGNFALPFPGFSPPAQWVVQQLVPDNSSSRIATWAHQYGAIGLKQLLPIPSWMQNALQAATAGAFNPDGWKAYVDSFLQMDQAAGMKFANSKEAVANAEGEARVFYLWKTGMSLLFPGAVNVQFPTQDLQNEYQNLITKYGPLKARDVFLSRHPEDWLIVTAKTVWEQQDPNLPSNFPSVPVPANELSDKILNSPGFREFAKANPWWAWAILPPQAMGADYNPDTFHKQLAAAQRTYLDPTDFYARGEAAAGWTAYWHLNEWWTAKQEALTASNISANDPAYLAAKASYTEQRDALLAKYPGFADAFGQNFGMTDPRPLLYARALVKNPFFMQFPIGKSLQDYLNLRDTIETQMVKEHVTSLGTVMATDSGLQAQYDQGVKQLFAENPQFQQVYNIFFSNDLTSGVPNSGEVRLEKLPPDARQAVFKWQQQYNNVRDEIGLAIDMNARGQLYNQQWKLVNQAYADYPASQNPILLWWDSQNYTTRRDTELRTIMKPYLYLNRFDRETVLGEKTDAFAEKQWGRYNAARGRIAAYAARNSQYDSGAAYKALDGWLVQQGARDPVLARQISYANTWGYEFFKNNPYIKGASPASQTWQTLQKDVAMAQKYVRDNGISGGSGLLQIKDWLISTIKYYQERVPTFATQWNYLEGLSYGSLVDVLVPKYDYPITGS